MTVTMYSKGQYPEDFFLNGKGLVLSVHGQGSSSQTQSQSSQPSQQEIEEARQRGLEEQRAYEKHKYAQRRPKAPNKA